MRVSENELETVAKVVPLFAKIHVESDPMKELLAEGITDWELSASEMCLPLLEERRLVTENNFPDQSVYILKEQVEKLKESIERIKFYLNDVDDLLPR